MSQIAAKSGLTGTAVGKALLLGTPPDEVRLLLQRNGKPRRTDMTTPTPTPTSRS